MARLPKFLTHMDKEARRAILIVCLMFAMVIMILLLGKASVTSDQTVFYRVFESFAASPWGVPVIIAIFVGAAFLGIPQWALITGTVLAFGPAYGSGYAWLATMISASVDFWLGRWIGARRLEAFGGDLVNRIISVVQRNGFVTSFAVRFVPTGPFILVNMAAGVSGMTYRHFSAGTALGIIPKIIVVALLAQGLLSGAQGDKIMLVFIALALLFVGVMLVARKRLKRHVDFEG